MSGLIFTNHPKEIAKFIETMETMGIMTMKITKGTRVVCAKCFEFLRWDQYVNMDFQNIQLKERFMDQRFKLRKFRTIVGGMPKNVTQSTWGCWIWGLRGWRRLGSLVL